MVKKKSNTYRILGIPYNVILIFLIIIPFFIMVLYAFNQGSGPFNISFTLEHFKYLIDNPKYFIRMADSLYLAILTTIIALLIAYPIAYFLVRLKPKNQGIFVMLITLPMWVNMLIQVNALKQLMLMFAPHLKGTNTIIIIGMVYMFLPYMVLPIYNSLLKIDRNLYESSADLGANSVQTLRRVILPLSMPGVISGITLVFLPASTTIIVAQYLGDGSRVFIGNVIEELMINLGYYGGGSAIAIILILIMVGLLFMVSKTSKYKEAE